MKYVATFILVLSVSCVGWATASDSPQGSLFSFGSASDQPIYVTSKWCEDRVIPGGRESTCTGPLKVTQGDLTLVSDKLVIVYDDDKEKSGSRTQAKSPPRNSRDTRPIRSIVASGNVKIAQHDRTVVAGRAEYDNAKRTITLTGGPPQFWHGRDHGSADTIIIYLDEERIEMRDVTWRLTPREGVVRTKP